MKYAKLGDSAPTVSRPCLGCMGFGNAQNGQHSWTVAEEQSRQSIQRSLEFYPPHPLVGVMAQNTAAGPRVWSAGKSI